MHTLLDLRCNLPVFVYLSEASVHDVKILDQLYIEPATIYVIDLGYLFHIWYWKRNCLGDIYIRLPDSDVG